MNKCNYCGRENPDDAPHCRECGTPLAAPAPPPEAAPPPATEPPAEEPTRGFWQTLKNSCVLAGIMLLGTCLYLLSFGPVQRCCGTATFAPSPAAVAGAGSGVPAPPGTNGTNVVVLGTIVRTVRYPAWVAIIYYPAFKLQVLGSGHSLYDRYLQWWWTEYH